MKELEYFPCYHSYLKKTDALSDAQLGRLFRALISYSMDGTIPELEPMEYMAFCFISDDIDRSREKYEAKCQKNRQNRLGKKASSPNKISDVAEVRQESPDIPTSGEEYPSVPEPEEVSTDNDGYRPLTTVNDRDQYKYKDKDKTKDKPKTKDKDKTNTEPKESRDIPDGGSARWAGERDFDSRDGVFPYILTTPAYLAFQEQREKQGLPQNPFVERNLQKELVALSGGDTGKMEEILQQSVVRGWKWVYPLSKQEISSNAGKSISPELGKSATAHVFTPGKEELASIAALREWKRARA